MFTKVRSQKSEVRSKNGKVKILFSIFCFLFSMFFSLTTNAQCAMCRAALGGDANIEKAKAVNDGIVYLMVIPYLLVAVIGYFVYRMRKNKTK
jgi:uncharacterized membrane protein